MGKNGGKRPGSGRKKYQVNDRDKQKVITFARIGTPQVDIARVLGIDVKTLEKYYRQELDCTAIEATAAIGGHLFTMAQTVPAAAMFWMKTRAGWRERDPEVQETKPIKIIFERGDTRKSQIVDIESDEETGTE